MSIYTIFWIDGQMVGFEMPQEPDLQNFSSPLQWSNKHDEWRVLCELARQSALPIAKEDEEKVIELLYLQNEGFRNWYDITLSIFRGEEYQIEADMETKYLYWTNHWTVLTKYEWDKFSEETRKSKVLSLTDNKNNPEPFDGSAELDTPSDALSKLIDNKK